MLRNLVDLCVGSMMIIGFVAAPVEAEEAKVIKSNASGKNICSKLEIVAGIIAILVISSEMPELIGLSDRIVVMASGRVVGEVGRADATEEGILALAMTDNINSARTDP